MEEATVRHDGMPPWIPRLLGLVVLTFLGTYALVWSLGRLRSLLLTLLLSFFISFALEPGVNFLAKRGLRRGLATSLVFASAVPRRAAVRSGHPASPGHRDGVAGIQRARLA